MFIREYIIPKDKNTGRPLFELEPKGKGAIWECQTTSSFDEKDCSLLIRSIRAATRAALADKFKKNKR